ncbi:MAG: DNA cytosine methyltransferase, partial [Phycisphaerales bacterium]|nr:DNA cytosine methyltransferase [Phycisphaerales bacterium]
SQHTAISLFTSGGLGDLALRRAGFDLLVSNELLEERHAVFQANFPDTHAITGDIWRNQDSILAATRDRLAGRELGLFYATPPCQGMSKNGRGKLLNAIRAGLKPPNDERNRLIVPTMQIARALRPETVVLENVPEMAETVIVDEDGDAIGIVEFIEHELGSEYAGRAEVVEFADYGVPQCRQRLITVFFRNPAVVGWLSRTGSLIAPPTHSVGGVNGLRRWRTVRDVIAETPPLDARDRESATSSIAYHRVPLLDPMKYWWVENTPPERSAFDNQCSSCGFDGNPAHSAKRDSSGINRASRHTPLFCARCGAMLPRPSVERGGERKLMRGFTSAYKRMSFDRPASALTRNLSYACSDNKLHPEQNRVLSLHEAFKLHTLDGYDYLWDRADGKRLSDKTVREIIGESIPPAGSQAIIDHLVAIREGRVSATHAIGPLFAASR